MESLIRLDVTFGVSYSSDPHEVSKLAIEAVKGIPRVQKDPGPVCWLTAVGESSLDFILRFWIRDPQNGATNVRGQVLLACWDVFEKAGIRHAYPRRDVTLRLPSDLPLRDEEREVIAAIARHATETP